MKLALGISACILAGIGFLVWYLNAEPPSEASLVGEQSSSLQQAEHSPILKPEGGPEVDPVSLIAFAEQEFRGSDFTVGRVLAENEAYTRYYITYMSGSLKISGIMNVPKGKGPFPLLMLNHGHIDTSIYTNGRGLKREQDYLARQGYVVIHSDSACPR